MYQKYQTEAIVLANREMGENDRVLALYTKDFGLVKARASAIRSEKSKARPCGTGKSPSAYWASALHSDEAPPHRGLDVARQLLGVARFGHGVHLSAHLEHGGRRARERKPARGREKACRKTSSGAGAGLTPQGE